MQFLDKKFKIFLLFFSLYPTHDDYKIAAHSIIHAYKHLADKDDINCVRYFLQKFYGSIKNNFLLFLAKIFGTTQG